jgi:hypothetical protein
MLLQSPLLIALAAPGPADAPPPPPPPSPPPSPRYECVAATQPVAIDGTLDDAAWSAAAWTEDFPDLRGRSVTPPPPRRTRAKLLWDESTLYVAAEMRDRDVWATMAKHDEMLYRENAFELFLDPDGDGKNYVEIQVNPLGTTLDLLVSRPYSQRGKGDVGFELKGLRAAVRVEGTVNDARDADGGWTVEIAIPWSSLRGRNIAPDALLPPKPGTPGATWRAQLAYCAHARGDETPAAIAAWSPAGKLDLHLPERWGRVEFAPAAGGPAVGQRGEAVKR